MRKLIGLTVVGLLDRFDHHVTFPAGWEFVILHGQNGVGKTKILELIRATFALNIEKLASIPFRSAQLLFDDGAALRLRRALNISSSPRASDSGQTEIEISLTLGKSERRTWTAYADFEQDGYLDRYLLDVAPYLTRVGRRTWRDDRDGEILGIDDIHERYDVSRSSHERFLRSMDETQKGSRKQIAEFTAGLQAHFIDTQRLIHNPAKGANRRVYRERYPSNAVEARALDLAERLQGALADNSRKSQELDRNLPKMVLSDKVDTTLATEDAIRKRYTEQSLLREQLSGISLLNADADIALPEKELRDWEKRFLWIYLDNMDKKLATFRQVLARVNLLTDIVNRRFAFKELRIDRDHGFKFYTDRGREILAEDLSSGEQHELVLTYDLLFNARPSTLVLIDEPEISLHVSWQQEFLDDISRIAKISNLRFIVATHSPQIVHTWVRRMVMLSATGIQERRVDR